MCSKRKKFAFSLLALLLVAVIGSTAAAAEIAFKPHKTSVPEFKDGASMNMKIGDIYGYTLTADDASYITWSDSTASSSNDDVVHVSTFFDVKTGEGLGPRFGMLALSAGTADVTVKVVAKSNTGASVTETRKVSVTVAEDDSGAPYVFLGKDKKVLNAIDDNSGVVFSMKSGETQNVPVEVIANLVTKAPYSYDSLSLEVSNAGSNSKVAAMSRESGQFVIKAQSGGSSDIAGSIKVTKGDKSYNFLFSGTVYVTGGSSSGGGGGGRVAVA